MRYGLEEIHKNETWARIIGKPLEHGNMGTPMTGNLLHTGLGFRMGENNEIEIADMDFETQPSGSAIAGSTGTGGTDVDILDIEMET